MADIITQEAYEIDYRSLERWPLPTRLVNNKSHVETVDGLTLAFERLDAAPVVMGGHKAVSQQQTA